MLASTVGAYADQANDNNCPRDQQDQNGKCAALPPGPEAGLAAADLTAPLIIGGLAIGTIILIVAATSGGGHSTSTTTTK